MCYIVSKICIRRFVGDYFYCSSQYITAVTANESLIPYKLIKKAPEREHL